MADNLFDMWNMGSLESEKIGEDNEDIKIDESAKEEGFKEIDPNASIIEDEDVEQESDEDIVDEDNEIPDEDDDIPEGFSFNPLLEDLRNHDILSFEDDDLKDFDGKSIDKVRELVEKSVEKKYQDKLNSIDPLAAKVLELAEKGAPIEEAFKTASSIIDFNEIDLDDVDNQKALISDHLSAQGYDEDYIEEKLTDLEDLDKLGKEAKVAAKFLEKRQNEQLKQYEETVQANKQKELKEYEDEVKEVKQTIDSIDEIAGFKLTKSERQAFKDYLFKPVTKDGLTQADIDNSLENRLKKEFMNFKQFNFEKVEKKAKSKVAKEVYKSMSNYTDSNANSRSDFSNRQVKESSRISGLPWI